MSYSWLSMTKMPDVLVPSDDLKIILSLSATVMVRVPFIAPGAMSGRQFGTEFVA